MIVLKFRLLAREVYARLVRKSGANALALITGEDKIIPPADHQGQTGDVLFPA
jgi:ATP-dependent RNA helicase SUPV3L1/SUV3